MPGSNDEYNAAIDFMKDDPSLSFSEAYDLAESRKESNIEYHRNKMSATPPVLENIAPLPM